VLTLTLTRTLTETQSLVELKCYGNKLSGALPVEVGHLPLLKVTDPDPGGPPAPPFQRPLPLLAHAD
jgi:hypothetical protein